MFCIDSMINIAFEVVLKSHKKLTITCVCYLQSENITGIVSLPFQTLVYLSLQVTHSL